MRIGYLSDLHLEFRNRHPSISQHSKTAEEQHGDVLLVAGDLVVAVYYQVWRNDEGARSVRKLLDYTNKNLFSKYSKVLYIAGNHEHYNGLFPRTVDLMREYWKGTNVHVMDNDFVDIDGVRIIGSTLWSDFHGGNPLSMENCRVGMNDFRVVYTKDPADLTYEERKSAFANRFLPSMALTEHNVAKQYIVEQAKSFDGKVVVMTHHGPTWASLNKERSDGVIDGGYCSDLSELILDNPNIKYWIHGHTHLNVDYGVGECNILANQCGYAGETSWKNFNGPKHFEI